MVNAMNKLLILFQNLRFKQKLFISYLVVCIIPVLVLGFFSYYQANNFLLQQARQNLDGSINQITNAINARSQQYESIINSITQNIVFKQIFIRNNGDFSEIYRDYVDPFFNNILDFNSDILQVTVFTDNNQLLRGEYILPIHLISDLNLTDGSKKAETLWVGKNGKVLAIRLFMDNVSKSDNQSTSLLFLSIDADRLFSGLDEIHANAYGVMIVDENDETILSKNVNLSRALSGDDMQALDLSEMNGYFKSDHTEYMYMKAEMPQTDWQIIFYTQKSGISVDARSIVKITVLIAVICLAILLFIIWIFSNTFVKRIIALNKMMTKVETGNLDLEVISSSKDEIGQLTNRFGRMLGNINTLIKEVYESKLTQKEAELKALQTQINPHFLYNTLSIVNWKALQIDALEISQIITTVSKFYRTVLNKGKNMTLVMNEIENAKAYMQIQLIMHNYSFDFECEVDEVLYPYEMIHLVFQPILENALEHGIDQIRKGTRRGKIVLSGFVADDNLLFTIQDNGPGMNSELGLDELGSQPNGYGLKNVHDRIRLRFGTPYGVSVSSELEQGTKVTFTFPQYPHDRKSES